MSFIGSLSISEAGAISQPPSIIGSTKRNSAAAAIEVEVLEAEATKAFFSFRVFKYPGVYEFHTPLFFWSSSIAVMSSIAKLVLAIHFTFLSLVSFAQEATYEDLLALQDYSGALAIAMQQDSSFEQQLKLGRCYYRLGQWRQAKESLEPLLVHDTFHVATNVTLASIYEQEYDVAKAIKHFNALVATQPNNSTYAKGLARVHEKAELGRLATDLYWRARRLNPSDISILTSLTAISFKKKQWSLADSLSDLGLQLDSTNIQTILAKARSQYATKNYSETVRFLRKTHGRIDLNPFYQKMLGYGYLQLDSLDKSIHILENLLYREESEHTHFYLALAYQKKANTERSIHHYEKAINQGISGSLGKYYGGLARMLKADSQTKDAMKAYGEAFEFTGNPNYLFQKAQLSEQYYKDKRMALDQYRQCVAIKSLNAEQLAFANDRIRLLKEYLHQKAGN